jgi:hypothetical protein
MLTKWDDYPVHQTPDPIAFAGTDRNFYDRYFFNGYSRDGSVFFAAALGVYPHLNIMDGAFCVVHQGIQHNVRVSRHLMMERMDTQVGPFAVAVLEPLHSLRLTLDGNDAGITADVIFESRAPAVKEPRFTQRIGPRSFMDYTRLTQSGSYRGWIDIAGRRIDLSPTSIVGTRDRSWGVRPIGLADPQETVPPTPFQFCWLWAPLNFDDRFTLYHLNADAQGEPWNTAAVMGALGNAVPEHIPDCRSEVVFVPGSRHAYSASLHFHHRHGPYRGGETCIDLKSHQQFYMSGLGYGHPEWAHGYNKGELAFGYDTIVLAQINTYAPPYLHVQTFVTADMRLPDGRRREGCGVLEQMVLGPYAPWGFHDALDPAPPSEQARVHSDLSDSTRSSRRPAPGVE